MQLPDFISPHPDLLGNCSMHCSTTYIPVGVPEHPRNGHKGEGTFCLYGGDADSCPVCGGGWYRLAIHYFTDNPVNVYGTAVIRHKCELISDLEN